MRIDPIGALSINGNIYTYSDFLLNNADQGADIIAQFVLDHNIEPDAVIVNGDTILITEVPP